MVVYIRLNCLVPDGEVSAIPLTSIRLFIGMESIYHPLPAQAISPGPEAGSSEAAIIIPGPEAVYMDGVVILHGQILSIAIIHGVHSDWGVSSLLSRTSSADCSVGSLADHSHGPGAIPTPQSLISVCYTGFFRARNYCMGYRLRPQRISFPITESVRRSGYRLFPLHPRILEQSLLITELLSRNMPWDFLIKTHYL